MGGYQQRCFFIDGNGPNRAPALFASLVVNAISDERELRITNTFEAIVKSMQCFLMLMNSFRGCHSNRIVIHIV